MSFSKSKISFLSWLSFAVIITPIMLFGLATAAFYWKANSHTSIAVGRLTNFVQRDHAQYDYQFFVAGKSYAGRGYYHKGNQGVRAVGKTVKVYYDISDPSTNSLSNLSDKGWSFFNGALLFWIFGLLVCLIISFIENRRASGSGRGA